MSLIVTTSVREGIVMASDSRLTLSFRSQEGENQITNVAVAGTDSVRKTFLTDCGVGISAYGAADIDGVPITGFIDAFIRELRESAGENVTPKAVADRLLEHFRGLVAVPDTGFHVAGYESYGPEARPKVYRVLVAQNSVSQVNESSEYEGIWDGESDVLFRLTQVLYVSGDGGSFQPVPQHPIHISYFTLQDAIDFCLYAVQVTRDTMRFQTRAKTVGGPVDVLVITPEGGRWVSQKTIVA